MLKINKCLQAELTPDQLKEILIMYFGLETEPENTSFYIDTNGSYIFAWGKETEDS